MTENVELEISDSSNLNNLTEENKPYNEISTTDEIQNIFKKIKKKKYGENKLSLNDYKNDESNYVLTNNNDFKGAADKYSVPYANVYNWVKKYNESGEDGLSDSRGRPSSKEPKHELSDIEKKDIEIEKLRQELKRKDMVIEVLKKNIEIQERMERDSRLLGKKTNTKR